MTTREEPKKTFRTSFVARLFGKSTQWVYWGEREEVFAREDGTLIIPRRTTPPRAKAGYRSYTIDDLRDIADALRRRGLIDTDEYLEVMGKIASEQLRSAV